MVFGKFGPKNQNCSFESKFCIKTLFNMENSVVTHTLSALHQKYPFWGGLLQTMKIVTSSCNFVFRLL